MFVNREVECIPCGDGLNGMWLEFMLSSGQFMVFIVLGSVKWIC